MHVTSTQTTDLALMHDAVDRYFGGEPLVSPSGVFYLDRLNGLKAVRRHEILGFVCYDCAAGVCEIVVLVSLVKRKGDASTLVAALRAKATEHGCGRLRAFTTNENVDAREFCKKFGFKTTAIHGNAMVEVRRYKPQLPAVGAYGIPLRDMIELEMSLKTPEV